MFNNIDGKLKGLAIVQTIIFIILGIVIWAIKGDIITAIVVILVGWISQWVLYAFGHLVEQTEFVNVNLTKILETMNKKESPKNASNSKAKSILSLSENDKYTTSKNDNHTTYWICEFCGAENLPHLSSCSKCKKPKK